MKKIAVILLVIVISFVFYTLEAAGFFKTIVSHSNIKEISIITNVAGTEDLDIDRESGLLFISSSDRWNTNGNAKQMDGIYVLDTKNANAQPIKLSTSYKGEFHPHGISLFKNGNKRFLFVVNHNQLGSFVEKFQFENHQLTHIQSYQNEQMCCPNDLVAVGENKFYVTNDHGAAKGIGRVLEDYLKLANSYLLYFDGTSFTKALTGASFANGVNVSRDGKTLYMTETSGAKLVVMNRNINTGLLTHRFTKQFKTGLDNIDLDDHGHLWIGAHPQLLAFLGHASNTGKRSPSQVLKLTHKGNDDFTVEEVYLNTGEQISGSSVALYYQGVVYVGVVFENKLLKGFYTNE